MTRNLRTILLTLMILALWGTSSSAAKQEAASSPSAPPGPLTVDEAVKMALANSSLIIGAEASVIDARSGLYHSYSSVLPSVTLSGSRNASNSLQTRGNQEIAGRILPATRQDVERYTNSPVLSGSWNFLDLSSLQGLSSARSDLHAAALSRKATRQDVALDARQKFYTVVRAIHLSRVSSEALRLARDDERRVRALFDVGSVSRSDLLKARVRTAQSQLDSLAKHNAILVNRIILATALGIEEGKMGEVDTTLTAEPQTYDEPQVLAEAEKARPDLQAAKASWDAARASVRAANYLRLPSLFATGSVTYRQVSKANITTYEGFDITTGQQVVFNPPSKGSSRSDVDKIYSGQVGLTWNIFTGFGNEGSIAASQAREMRAKDGYEVLKRNLASEVKQTLQTYRELVEGYDVAQRAIESAEENMKLTQQKYNVGSSTILDLIDAQVQLQTAQSDVVSALAGMRVGEATVEKVRGRGD